MKKLVKKLCLFVLANLFIVLSFMIALSDHYLEHLEIADYIAKMSFFELLQLLLVLSLFISGIIIDFLFLIRITSTLFHRD